jgi:hypothetical protein
MAFDYSKLSDEELEAIANNDYSKMSDATLEAIANAGETQPSDASVNMAPQAVSIAGRVAGPVAEVAKDVGTTAYNVGKAVVGYPIDVAKNAMSWTPRSVAEVVTNPLSTAKAYIMNHPIMESNASLRTVGKEAAQYAKNIGGRIGTGLVQGALAPESLFALPYQMAAYEQEKIRENPNAPGLEYNPYAQMYRGEYPTQGAAGAANRRAAISRPNTGYVPTPQEAQNIMASGDQRMINMYGGKDRLAELMRQKAAERVLGPVAPR